MNPRALYVKLLSVLLTICVLLTGIPMVSASTVDDLSNTALSLYEETYKSLIGRITDRGYTETSLTGAYSGMYLRDSAIQIMAQNAYGDYHLSREMLQFILGQHQDLGWEYTQHILGYFNETNANYENTYLTASADLAEAYLGCADIGSEQWNIQSDYVYGAFVPDTDVVENVRVYVKCMTGSGTLGAAICTDVYGKGDTLGEASVAFSVTKDSEGWQTLTFDTPVTVTKGQTYYLRLGSDGGKVTLWGASTDGSDENRAYVDAGRSGGGWRTNYLPNFVINGGEASNAYLGCTDLGDEHWNIQNDYIWAPFASDANYVEYIKAYVRVFAGSGTLTAAICTDYYGKGEVLAEATLPCNYAENTKGWQTLTFDQPVAIEPGRVYYIRFGSDDVKVTLWGKDSPSANNPWAEHVDDKRTGSGWTNNRLVNFEVSGGAAPVSAYLGCTEVGTEQWNIQNDYVYGAFVPDANSIEYVKAYVKAFAGTGTLTAAICTDVYGEGTTLGTATISLDNTGDVKDWQTLTFDTPVAVIPGQTYYLRLGSDGIKVTLWGTTTEGDDENRAYVDDHRTGGGWRTNYLPNFVIPGNTPSAANTYLGCTEVGTEQWNIQSDYVYGAFVPNTDSIEYVKAYVKAFAGTGTLTAAICTDVYGEGQVLGTAILDCDYTENKVGWQTLTFDTPVAVTPGQTYYLRLGSNDVKVTLWGTATTDDDENRSYVDAGRAGSGWRTNYLPNFEIPGASVEESTVILTLDGTTAGTQVVPVLDNEKISSLRVILSRDANASGILKATLSKGYGANATRVDWFEMDVEKIPVDSDWVKLSFSLPITQVDAEQDYSLTLELVDASGKVYWHGTNTLDQYGTYALVDDQYSRVPGEASFEAYKTGGASIWSKEIQPDGNYMFIHAWYQYATGCLDNEDNRTFINESYPVIRTYANYYLDNGYIGENGLMRNPYFEHSREGRKWNSYDLITNVFASQALYEMSTFATAHGDAESAAKWSAASAALNEAIENHLVIEYDGVTIYAELYDVDNGTFIPGISWVNLAPMAAEWYAMDTTIMQNTLDLYGVYATTTIRGYEMLYTNGTLGEIKDGVSVIGKGLSWEIMYYHAIDNKDREEYLLSFIETVAAECGVYPENYRNDRLADPGNQEHASWQFYAVSFAHPELTKNYALNQLAALVTQADNIDVNRLREESLGEPLDNVYALSAKAQKALMNERTTKDEADLLAEELLDALDYLSYVDEAPRARLLPTGGQTSKMEMSETTLGLAFSFTLEMDGAAVNSRNVFDSTNATVDVAKNNISYQLVRMGAIITNNRTLGEDAKAFTLDNTNDFNAKDVPAVYAYDVGDTYATYAVRLTNIPLYHDQTPIYARPYYVYLFNGEEVVVYGDVYSQSYTPQDSNDVTMDW